MKLRGKFQTIKNQLLKKGQKKGNKKICFPFVRMEGLEPPRREAPDPKSGAATNYATCAWKC